MKITTCFLLVSSVAWAQSPSTTNQAPAPQSAAAARVSPDAQVLNEFLRQVQISAQKSDGDLARLRVDKWKAEAASKQQAEASTVSIRRNLTSAVPDLVQRIQASPSSLNANFRLYRNLNALYDTFSALAETAGAFGPKEQYDPLAGDIAQLDQLRHQAAERVDSLAGANDAELARLRAQVAATGKKSAASKIVVDDDPPKAKKKSKSPPTPAQNH